ncbi:hypothetical protein O1Q96_30750 [Streptomyces sp. Qhu-G9]|uniref:DUF6777 domain-containing protein n=1 Tax=Streptomyces sp. Qhu-G9 TaxID=3452799 RepID=UPI0022AC4E4E|nr:DUF6777 domain-containing protein [Streptomyces aurantiacus]WAU83690.1 hypothetical protein O1Q96_30750 [Streptomyces aurantiacus]
MRLPTGTLVTACALSTALLVVGCAGGEDGTPDASGTPGGEVFLQPAAARGPDPFTASTVTTGAPEPPVTPTPRPSPTATAEGVRSVSGATPGLYSGTQRVGSCDVERQTGLLTADRARARAFTRAAGIPLSDLAGHLRGLTPVVLRADTRVTSHGFRDGRAAGYQAVLQAGTAVLVDNRGVPSVRCACGNPLKPPAALHESPAHRGRPWPGYRPSGAVLVTPAPQVIVEITIIDVRNNTWIERRTGDHDGDEDRVVPRPAADPQSPDPQSPDPQSFDPDGPSLSPDEPSRDGSSAESSSGTSEEFPEDCATPIGTVTVTPGESAPSATEDVTDTASPDPSACPTVTVTATPSDDVVPPPDDTDTPPGTAGPDTVPDAPDVPDGGGLIPD